MKCYCDLDQPYEQCCGYFHSGQGVANNALELMRSRYSAYACGHRDYLLATWHADTRPKHLELDESQRWLGLKIKAFNDGEHSAEVRFVARYKIAGKAYRLEEHSLFSCDDGRWYYLHALADT